MPDACSVSVSCDSMALPVAVSCAPAAFEDVAQPWSGDPKLPHGHAVPDPSPEQYGVAFPPGITITDIRAVW